MHPVHAVDRMTREEKRSAGIYGDLSPCRVPLLDPGYYAHPISTVSSLFSQRKYGDAAHVDRINYQLLGPTAAVDNTYP
jgi:hypothetical protein